MTARAEPIYRNIVYNAKTKVYFGDKIDPSVCYHISLITSTKVMNLIF